MELLELPRTVVRRWYVATPILLCSLAAAAVLQRHVPDKFEATGWVEIGSRAFEADGRIEIDPEHLFRRMRIEGAGSWVSPLQGRRFSIAGTADSAREATETAETIIAGLQSQAAALQEEAGVALEDRVEVRRASQETEVVSQAGGDFVALVEMYVLDPTQGGGSPLAVGGTTASMLMTAAMGDADRLSFFADAPDGTNYVVHYEPYDAAPLLQVVTTGPTPDETLEAFSLVTPLLTEDLSDLQGRQGATAPGRRELRVLSRPLYVEEVSPPIDRSVIALVVVGGLASIVAAALWDLVARRRSGRHDPSPEAQRKPRAPPASRSEHGRVRTSVGARAGDAVASASESDGVDGPV